MGYGVSYPGVGAAPQRARHHLRPAALRATCPAHWLEWHGHNDFYKVVTNADARLAVRLLVRQLLAAGHRRAHGQLPAGGHGHRVRPLRGTHGRHGPYRHHRHRRVLRAGHRLRDSAARRPLWAAPSTRRAPASTPTACSRTRRSTTSSTPRTSSTARPPSPIGQPLRPCGHRPLDERLLQSQGRGHRGQARRDCGQRSRSRWTPSTPRAATPSWATRSWKQMVFAADPEFFEELMAHKRVL